jgi:glutamyl-Q tRNA(Asp) synthetase
MTYRGRFAPSPTGPLHFGSLVAAVGSYLEAHAHGGEWLVRIDDLDPPRVVPGAADDILRTLEGFGFEWDGDVVYQGRRNDAYHAALHRLRATGLVYPCACSRKEVMTEGIVGIEGFVYPGTCRYGLPAGRPAHALRLDARGEPVAFDDAIQGRVEQDIGRAVGDFVLYRTEGVFSYHLACAVDDAEQGITHVVRGADLLASTARQILIQRLLGLPLPHYAHLPVALNAAGEKLSKQNLAPAVEKRDAAKTLVAVLAFLGQQPPAALAATDVTAVWAWAHGHWSIAQVPRERGIEIAA